MRHYVTLAALALILAAGGCSAKHPSDPVAASAGVAASPAAEASVASPAPSLAAPVAPVAEPVATSVPAELPPPKEKKPEPAHKRIPAAHRARAFEDPRRIPEGISYDEMVRRFGPPSIAVTDGPGRSSLSYTDRTSRVQVELQNGHVISVASSATGR